MSVYIMTAIEWCIVPVILAIILFFSLFIFPDQKADYKVKISARAGKWAGLIVLVLFIVSQKNRELSISFKIPEYDFAIFPTLISSIIGFVSAWGLDQIKHSRVVGIFVLALVGSTSITLYSYIFISNVRSLVVFFALGVMFGVLLHEIIFPESMQSKIENIVNK